MLTPNNVIVLEGTRQVSINELKQVPGLNNRFVTEDGLVFRMIKNTTTYVEMRQHCKKGYLFVGVKPNFPVELTTRSLAVHRLICLTFNGYPPDFTRNIVNHIDGKKI
jgi:hypothetical protein